MIRLISLLDGQANDSYNVITINEKKIDKFSFNKLTIRYIINYVYK